MGDIGDADRELDTHLEQLFWMADRKRSGCVSVQALHQVLTSQGFDLTFEQFQVGPSMELMDANFVENALLCIIWNQTVVYVYFLIVLILWISGKPLRDIINIYSQHRLMPNHINIIYLHFCFSPSHPHSSISQWATGVPRAPPPPGQSQSGINMTVWIWPGCSHQNNLDWKLLICIKQDGRRRNVYMYMYNCYAIQTFD